MEPPTKLALNLEPLLLERSASPPACPKRSRRVKAERSSAVASGLGKRRTATAPAVLIWAAMIASSANTLFAQTPTASPPPAPTASSTPAPPAEPEGGTRGGD